MSLLIESIKYVMSDSYFWSAMGLTTCMGLFIGAVLYDGVLKEVKKVLIALGSYCLLILATNLTRIIPIIKAGEVGTSNQPLAGTVTILLVSLFYFAGMVLGVKITNFAHQGRER